MEFVSGLALVLLTLVGYSSGAVLGARRKTPVPGLLDLLVVVILWAAALLTRSAFGKWPAIAAWLAIGLLVGALLARVRVEQYPKAPASASARNLWEAWKGFARHMGNYQSRTLMGFLYFTVVLPFGTAVTLLSDPLKIKQAGRLSTTWQPKHIAVKPSLEEAGRQF
jgi:uncharacterized membrane protein YoaK (UPF0700 family)